MKPQVAAVALLVVGFCCQIYDACLTKLGEAQQECAWNSKAEPTKRQTAGTIVGKVSGTNPQRGAVIWFVVGFY